MAKFKHLDVIQTDMDLSLNALVIRTGADEYRVFWLTCDSTSLADTGTLYSMDALEQTKTRYKVLGNLSEVFLNLDKRISNGELS
jgi:hypothetical protein